MIKTIIIGCDHTGIELKDILCQYLKRQKINVIDLSAGNENCRHYPVYGALVASAVSKAEAARGIVICGTGIGISNAANRIQNIRACLVHNSFMLKTALNNYQCNILALGAWMITAEMAVDLVAQFVNFPTSKSISTLTKTLLAQPKHVPVNEAFFDQWTKHGN